MTSKQLSSALSAVAAEYESRNPQNVFAVHEALDRLDAAAGEAQALDAVLAFVRALTAAEQLERCSHCDDWLPRHELSAGPNTDLLCRPCKDYWLDTDDAPEYDLARHEELWRGPK